MPSECPLLKSFIKAIFMNNGAYKSLRPPLYTVPSRSQMISQEDFSVISRLDSGDPASRDKVTG